MFSLKKISPIEVKRKFEEMGFLWNLDIEWESLDCEYPHYNLPVRVIFLRRILARNGF